MFQESKLPHSLDWVTLIIVSIALVLGWMHYYKVLPEIGILKFGRNNNDEERDIGKTDLREILLDFCFFIIISLLITQFILLLSESTYAFNGWKLFLKVILGLAIYLIAQRFVHTLHGYITNSTAFFSKYNTTRVQFLQQSSLFIFPFLILSIYAPIGNVGFIWIANSIFIAFFVFSIINTIRYTVQLKGHFIYHIIFYLCAIEILPIFLLYKTLT